MHYCIKDTSQKAYWVRAEPPGKNPSLRSKNIHCLAQDMVRVQPATIQDSPLEPRVQRLRRSVSTAAATSRSQNGSAFWELCPSRRSSALRLPTCGRSASGCDARL